MPAAPTRLSALDLGIVAAYLVAITLFGLRFSRKQKQGAGLKSYFLADNTIPWWAIALSIVSAETSTLTIISIPGVAFAGDLGFLQIVLGYMLGRIVVALLFLPRYFRGEMLTAYQLIDRRFGTALHRITAGLFLATRAAAEGVRVFAISIVVGIAIGTGDTLSIAIISALTLLYTFEGGMAAVIWTDVVQMALYVAGTVVALWTLGAHVPGGWAHIHAVAAPLGKFHWLNFTLNLTTTYTFWAGVLGGTFLTMASHGTDQLMVQRMLAARNLGESRLALLSSGVVIFFQFLLFLLIGVGLFVFYQAHPVHFASADRIFPTFIVTELPHGVAGLLVAAILAAAMSNLSAALNSLASTTVVDFWLPLRNRPQAKQVTQSESKDLGDNHRAAAETAAATNTTLISRAATVVWAVILFLIAVYSIKAGGKGHVVETGLSIASVAYGSLLGVFLLGTLTRYATQTGAIAGMVTGFALNLWLWLWQAHFPKQIGPVSHPYMTIPHVAYTWYVLLGAIATFAVGTAVSFAQPRRRAILATLLLVPTALVSSRSAAGESAVRTANNPHASTCALSSFAEGGGPAAVSVRNAAFRAGGPAQTNLGRKVQVQTVPNQSAEGAAHSPTTVAPGFTPVSALIDDAIAAGKLPGAVVVIGHNGHIAFEHAYGDRKLAGEPGLDGKPSAAEAMTEDTIFDMASLTKVIVTTTAVLQLHEQGKIDLDTPVAHYLPDFARATPPPASSSVQAELSSFAAGGGSASVLPTLTPQQLAWKQHITVRELLTHYSGLPEDVPLKDPWGLAAPDKAEGIRRALAAAPYGPPGVTFKYSDINFITLGALVEKLSGQQLDGYAQAHVLGPLGMSGSGYHSFDKSCGTYGVTHLGSASAFKPVPPTVVTALPNGGFMVRPPGSPARCDPAHFWSVDQLENVAPTAHDDQGTPATNPDFDHLLRGTVHDPTARRMGGVAGHAGVFSNAADMSKFAQALLDKLLRNTGPFPLKQRTLQMATSPQAPATASHDQTIFLQDGTTAKGVAERGLGWDLNSAFSRPRGTIFPIATGGYGKPGHPGSFGHTGFTGTSLWIDPTSDTYVILLANSVHPRVKASISPLRGEVATAAARALGLDSANPAQPLSSFAAGGGPAVPAVAAAPPQRAQLLSSRSAAEGSASQPGTNPGAPSIAPSAMDGSNPQTLTGIDVLESTQFAQLKSLRKKWVPGKPDSPWPLSSEDPLRIAILTNQSGVDAHGNRTIDVLMNADPNIHVVKIFTPEHGLSGKQDTEHLASEADSKTHIPVISLYGPHPQDRHPREEDLENVDLVVIDLQDIGTRFWTYETVVRYFLQENGCHSDRGLLLLDRPNPVGGLAVQGPTSDSPKGDLYINSAPMPVRHGLTMGELARYFEAHPNPVLPIITCDTLQGPAHFPALTVIPMQHWSRAEFFPATGLPWTPPSPNMKHPSTAVVYPGVALLETTNLSVGRGTANPYENLGAAWMLAPEKLAAYLNSRHIPGIQFSATTLTIDETPEHYPGHGTTIPGLHLTVTDPVALDSPEMGVELLSALHKLYPADFQLAKANTILANADTLARITAGEDPRAIAQTWAAGIARFRSETVPFLLYPEPNPSPAAKQ